MGVQTAGSQYRFIRDQCRGDKTDYFFLVPYTYYMSAEYGLTDMSLTVINLAMPLATFLHRGGSGSFYCG